MSLSEYNAFKETLSSRISVLEGLVTKVESYKLLLEEKTKGYIAAITKQKPPHADTWFYLIRWFRTFVGIKDEAMLLINGELMRKYHKQQHDAYLHSRGTEEKYYKSGLLGLSGCSADGLNYDLRRISHKYAEFAVSICFENCLFVVNLLLCHLVPFHAAVKAQGSGDHQHAQ